MKEKNQPRKPNAIENNLFGCTVQELPKMLPGMLLAVLLVVISIWLTDRLNSLLGFKGLISYILTVIVAGILVRNFVNIPSVFIPGINFCLRKLLRLGIILMGIRLSIFDVFKIGVWGIPIVAACVVIGIAVTRYFGRLFKIPERLTALIAVGTGICGASAIVATAPGINAKYEEVTYAVANITVFGIAAMVIYPFLAHWIFQGNTTMVGLFTGTSIHETAQVAASALIYDQTFGTSAGITVADIATVSKLVRNALMVIVIPAITFMYTKGAGEVQTGSGRLGKALKLFPLFILGFLVAAVVRSIGDAGIRGTSIALGILSQKAWADLIKGITLWSGYILATAMAGVGLGTSFKSMKGLGIKPFYVGLLAATFVGVVSIVAVFLLGRFVRI